MARSLRLVMSGTLGIGAKPGIRIGISTRRAGGCVPGSQPWPSQVSHLRSRVKFLRLPRPWDVDRVKSELRALAEQGRDDV
jgi:hypothetical protein